MLSIIIGDTVMIHINIRIEFPELISVLQIYQFIGYIISMCR